MIVGLLVHIGVSAMVALYLASIVGQLTPWISLTALVTGTVVAIPAARTQTFRFDIRNLNVWTALLYLGLLILCWRHFDLLLFSKAGGLHTLGINNYGDLPLHITYIRHFSEGGSFWPQNPVFAGDSLKYPFGMDLYNALWESIGVELPRHLFWTGIISGALAIMCFHRWGGWLLVGGFFLNGGAAGWTFLSTGVLNDYSAPLAWKNFFLSLFITQRGFLWALPAGCFLLKEFRDLFTTGREWELRRALVLGLIWGMLPFFHAHSFVAVSLMIGIEFVCSKYRRSLWPAVLVAVPLGALFVLLSSGGGEKAGVIHTRWGWLASDLALPDMAFSAWQNLGPWLLLFLWITWEAVRGSLKPYRKHLLGLLVVGSFFNVVMFAPWDWDNIKLIIWPYFGLCALAGQAMKDRFKGVPGPAIIGIVLCLSGGIAVAYSVKSDPGGYEMYRTQDLDNTRDLVRSLSPDSVFVTLPTHNHPVSYWGRRVAMGYAGHIWSHGISPKLAEQRAADIEAIYTGATDWRGRMMRMGATHIYWSRIEQAQYGSQPGPWATELKNISSVAGVEVYEFRQTTTPGTLQP